MNMTDRLTDELKKIEPFSDEEIDHLGLVKKFIGKEIIF